MIISLYFLKHICESVFASVYLRAGLYLHNFHINILYREYRVTLNLFEAQIGLHRLTQQHVIMQ
jgi:hypothetical protein